MFSFFLLIVIYVGIYSVLAMSLNLVVGYTGLLSLCQAAFFAIGAYTTAIGMVTLKLNFWLIFPLSGVIASLLGLLVGLPTIRLKGDYLAIATLGFGEIVRNVILNWDPVTRGPLGFTGVPNPSFFGYPLNPFKKWPFVILVWVFVLLVYLLFRYFLKSRFGRALKAVREDEIAVSSLGINPVKFKIAAFLIGGFIAGMAGSIWAVFNQAVMPDDFTFMLSFLILCMVVLGGQGNLISSLAGAVIVVSASELPRLFGLTDLISPQLRQILFGMILVLMMIYRPQGIFPPKASYNSGGSEKK